MLGRIKRWWRNRQRNIFSYWDGSRDRSIDPLIAYQGLETHPVFNWETHAPDAINGVDWESQEITANAIRDVFGIPEFDDDGLTIAECVVVLMQFTQYCMDTKKKSRLSPTLQVPTEPESSETSTTQSSSDSGSTSDESKSAEPTPS